MANPQKEDGYTAIANELMEAFSRIKIPAKAMQILFVILRKTYGFNKKEDSISLSQFSKLTGIPTTHIPRNLSRLQEMRIITITKIGNSSVNKYRFNKNFECWKAITNSDTTKKGTTNLGTTKIGNYQKRSKGITKNGQKVLPNLVHTKDSITKDSITKANARARADEVKSYSDPNFFIVTPEERKKFAADFKKLFKADLNGRHMLAIFSKKRPILEKYAGMYNKRIPEILKDMMMRMQQKKFNDPIRFFIGSLKENGYLFLPTEKEEQTGSYKSR
jgi:phage replication O-like protein O